MKERKIRVIKKNQRKLEMKQNNRHERLEKQNGFTASVEQWISDIRETKARRELIESRVFFGT